MKRYLVFFGNQNYPEGGMEDLLSSTDSIEEGINLVNKEISKDFEKYHSHLYDNIEEFIEFEWGNKWASIYDLSKETVVWEKMDNNEIFNSPSDHSQ